MPRVLSRVIVALLAVALCPSISPAQGLAFRFTAIPSQDEAELKARFGKLALYLEQKLGVPVTYVPFDSYDAAVKAFARGDVQLAWLGGYSGLLARRAVPGSEAIAQTVEDMQFKSYFIAHTSTGLKPSKDFPRSIAGKTFLFGAPLSTSGRLMPEYYIRHHLGLPPKKAFSRVSFSGDHSSTLDLVQAGVVQVGVLNYLVYEAAKKAGKVDESKVTVIWETPPFPDNAFFIRGDADEKFGEGFKLKVKQAIIAIDDKEILKSFERSKFVAASNEQYEFIEEVADLIEADETPKMH